MGVELPGSFFVFLGGRKPEIFFCYENPPFYWKEGDSKTRPFFFLENPMKHFQVKPGVKIFGELEFVCGVCGLEFLGGSSGQHNM